MLISRYKDKLSSFFFNSVTSTNLGICRLIFFGITLLIYFNHNFSLWSDVPPALWYPVFIFKIFPIPILDGWTLGILGNLWLVSLFLSCIGLFTKTSTIFAFLCGTYLVTLTNSIGKSHHIETLFIIVLLVMAISYCGDGFSLDHIISKKFRHGKHLTRFKGEYSWPIKLIWILVTFVFCAAGFSKLRNSGIEWITGNTLSNYFIGVSYVKNRTEPMFDWLAICIATKPYICNILAGITVILEVSAPLALFNKYLRIIIIPGLFIMLSSFWILLGIPFPQMLSIFAFFIPWDKVAGKFGIIDY